ncbi:hypothetical protein [Spirosoma luteum]|uniref:hypothetical protein n=1 Tax=Spirosoma luteum TaxID=431553 RepID=UPI0003791708|nr:hypothetical protein [Spirosoma luteum]
MKNALSYLRYAKLPALAYKVGRVKKTLLSDPITLIIGILCACVAGLIAWAVVVNPYIIHY